MAEIDCDKPCSDIILVATHVAKEKQSGHLCSIPICMFQSFRIAQSSHIISEPLYLIAFTKQVFQ